VAASRLIQQPDLQFDTLTGLADWLDANLDAAASRST
jgi:FMN hydrolase / 5-amino-6-(5-phospho-D-ribitylamino)uracil phosphatase